MSELDLQELQLDSTSIKVHLAAFAGRRTVDEKKMMPTVDAKGQLAQMRLSPGQDGVGPHGRELLGKFSSGPIVENVLADAAYDGDETRQKVNQLKAKPCIIPSKS